MLSAPIPPACTDYPESPAGKAARRSVVLPYRRDMPARKRPTPENTMARNLRACLVTCDQAPAAPGPRSRHILALTRRSRHRHHPRHPRRSSRTRRRKLRPERKLRYPMAARILRGSHNFRADARPPPRERDRRAVRGWRGWRGRRDSRARPPPPGRTGKALYHSTPGAPSPSATRPGHPAPTLSMQNTSRTPGTSHLKFLALHHDRPACPARRARPRRRHLRAGERARAGGRVRWSTR
jgi:hypothetical protein